MSRFWKVCIVVVAAGIVAPPLASAKAKSKGSSEAKAKSSAGDAEFERTREFMRKKSEESKRTGKM